jgi:hypothetical protein
MEIRVEPSQGNVGLIRIKSGRISLLVVVRFFFVVVAGSEKVVGVLVRT